MAAQGAGELSMPRSALQAAPFAVALIRAPDYRHYWVNDAYRRLSQRRGDAVGRTLNELWPELPAGAYADLEQTGRTREPSPERLTSCRVSTERGADDEHFGFSFVPVLDDGGEAILVVARDATREVRARERATALAQLALDLNAGRDLEEVMRTALTRAARLLSAPDGSLFLLDEHGRYYGALELVDRGRLGLVLDEEDLRNLQRAFRTAGPVFVDRSTAPDDPHVQGWWERTKLESSLMAPLRVDGHDLGFLFVNFERAGYRPRPEDFDFAAAIAGQCASAIDRVRLLEAEKRARARAEQTAREVQQRAAQLGATISAIADAVMIFGPEGEVVSANPAAEQMIGLGPSQAGQPYLELIAQVRMQTPDGRVVQVDEMPAMRALRGETVTSELLELLRPDGNRQWISASAGPVVVDGTLCGAVVTLSDVSALKALEEQREELVRMISHDLRTPLSTVLMQAQMLLRNPGDKVPRRAEAIITSSHRMNAMIQDLVDMTRLEVGSLRLNRRPTNLRSFVTELKDRLAGTMPTDRLALAIPDALPALWVDPDRLERILTNLLSNALKYSPEGSEVRLEASDRGGEVTIAVVDQGAGIAPEEAPKLFARFFRAKDGNRRVEGLGLGLYITRLLAEAHGGRVGVDSRPGRGSRFEVTLPAAQEPAHAGGP